MRAGHFAAVAGLTKLQAEPVKEVTFKSKVLQIINTLPRSWLRVSDVEQSQSRQRVVPKGYSQVSTNRLRQLIETGLAHGGAKDAKKPFDPKDVEKLVGKDWTEFSRLTRDKGFTIRSRRHCLRRTSSSGLTGRPGASSGQQQRPDRDGVLRSGS